MIRRPSPLIALCSGALMIGTLLGVATNLPRVSVKPAYASEQEPARGKVSDTAKDAAPSAGKGGAGTHCKVTKECQEDLVCQKVGDHKECTATAIKAPKHPVVT
jgi:hypothetical protein